MFSNYLKVALRNLARHKAHALINVFGLAVGLAACTLIMLYVQYEFSFDRFHKNLDSLYLVPTKLNYGGNVFPTPGAPPAVGPAYKEEFPEIVNTARMDWATLLVKFGDKSFQEHITLVDPSYLEMFSFPLVEGDAATALADPRSIVISTETAHKFFGDADPLGRTLQLGSEYEFRVTGVTAPAPSNSSWPSDFLAPLSFNRDLYGENYIDTWYNCSFYTFAQLAPGTSVKELDKKIAGRIDQTSPETKGSSYLFPLADYHLHSISGSGGRIDQVIMFLVIAVGILLIACFNFVNLSTARAATRAKEVSIRKVVGASRGELVRQFYTESFICAMLAMVVGLALAETAMPIFHNLTGQPLSLLQAGPGLLAAWVVGITFLTGLLAGSYPSLVLPAFKPIVALKGSTLTDAKAPWFRRTLVVLQFTLSIVLIIGTVTVYRQHRFLLNKDLGYDKNGVVEFWLSFEEQKHYDAIKHDLLADPRIQSVTMLSNPLTGIWWNGSGWTWEGKPADVDPFVSFLGVDEDFPKTLKTTMVQGRFFSPEQGEATGTQIVINETFAKLIDTGSVVGKQILGDEEPYTVIGVIKDFYFKPLGETIGPLMIFYRPEKSYVQVCARVDPNDVKGAIAYMKSTWDKFVPDHPFVSHLLVDDLHNLYRSADLTGRTLLYFAGLAILVSCLGLLGLAAYLATQRTKEIGIRKLLGATVTGLIRLLTREFVILAAVANIIAWPIAYFAMTNWLYNYANRVNMGIGVFLLAGGAAILIAVVTVSYQALRAARANPVDALRYE